MRRLWALALGALTLAFAPAAYATPSINDLTHGLDTFVSDATGSLPFAASAGLDWSDAYIGSIVGVPPHFGLGLTAGATTLPKKAVEPLISALGGSLNSDLPLPSLGVNARVGGFVLPFDVGLKVGFVPDLTLGDYTVNYKNFGFDVRYAVFQGEPLLPNVSVGGGVDYFASTVKASYGSDLKYTYGGHDLLVGAPKATLDLSALVFEAKAQVSKSFFIVTPYLGLSALVGSSKAKAKVASTIDASDGGQAYWASLVPGLTSAGFGKDKSAANFGLKVYGGTSINLLLFRLDLQGLYSFLDHSYGGTVGARFQL